MSMLKHSRNGRLNNSTIYVPMDKYFILYFEFGCGPIKLHKFCMILHIVQIYAKTFKNMNIGKKGKYWYVYIRVYQSAKSQKVLTIGVSDHYFGPK